MSTKIWTAYRLKPGYELFDTLRDIRSKAFPRITKLLQKEYDKFVENSKDRKFREGVVSLTDKPQTFFDTPEKYKEHVAYQREALNKPQFTQYDAYNYYRRKYYEAKKSIYKDYFDLDVSLTIWELNHKYYFIPYPGSGVFRSSLAFLRKYPRFEDFHYQNQTDYPKHISAREWAVRKKTWDKLLESDGHNEFKLVMELVTHETFMSVCPYWQAYFKKSRAQTVREQKARDKKLKQQQKAAA